MELSLNSERLGVIVYEFNSFGLVQTFSVFENIGRCP